MLANAIFNRTRYEAFLSNKAIVSINFSLRIIHETRASSKNLERKTGHCLHKSIKRSEEWLVPLPLFRRSSSAVSSYQPFESRIPAQLS